MRTEQRIWTEAGGWKPAGAGSGAASAQLVLAFGATAVLQRSDLIASLHRDYPGASIFGCSTAGEICGAHVADDSLVVTAVSFEDTQLVSVCCDLSDVAGSFAAGELLGKRLPRAVVDAAADTESPLVHVLVLTDGLKINGSEFVSGLAGQLPPGVGLTGGLAADGARFGQTLVFRDGAARTNAIAAVGLYGRRLKIGYGSLGGWDSFGPERLITRSAGNVLYELDGFPALALYKQYLGERAKGLPSTGLLFPLSIRTDETRQPIVRTILAVDEDRQSLTFAGDVPEGARARLMKANFSRLIHGAGAAAQSSCAQIGTGRADLALLISCVGRKLVLQQRVEDELEAVREVVGSRATYAGFYSYGEISPFGFGASCELHNQTMTVTTLAEE